MNEIAKITTGIVLFTFLLAACASFVGLTINSDTATEFYYVRADIWATNEFDDPAKRETPAAQIILNRYRVGATVPALNGVAYVIVPICGGQPQWGKLVRPVVHMRDSIKIDC